MELVSTMGAVVSALAALGALVFAFETVRETRALRREDRLARLPEGIAELGQMALGGGYGDPRYAIERERVATMLASLDDPLPNCRRLAEGEGFAAPSELAQPAPMIEAVTREALPELAALLRAKR